MSRYLLPILFVAVSLAGCSKKKEAETKKMADLCVQAGEALARDSSTASADDFESLLSSALQACSQACDGDDKPSCKALDTHLHKVCKVMNDACDTLCKTAHSPSLKQTACDVAAQGSKR